MRFFRFAGIVPAGAVLALAVHAAPASAAFQCEASALRGTVLTAPAIEPVTANKGASACKTASGGGANVLPAPLSASVVAASTTAGTRTADASGGVVSLGVGLPDPLLQTLAQIRQQLVQQALSQVPPLTVPGVGTVDLTAAATTLLTPINGELLRVTGLNSLAHAECSSSGSPVLTGSSQVAGVRVLGVDLPVNAAVEQAIKVVGGQGIDLSQLDVTQLTVAGVDLTPLQQTIVKPLLAALPTIQIPDTLGTVKITPAEQEKTATRLTQRALRVQLGLASQSILDLTIGEATVGAEEADCATSTGAVAQQALQCTSRRLVLIDVLQQGNRVRLYGAADKRYVGQRVRLFFLATGRRVAMPKVAKDGTFRAYVPVPRGSLRASNRARYEARIGRYNKSLPLKLTRRMVVTGTRVSGGRVRISGFIRKPLAEPRRAIVLKQRLSCTKTVTVGKIKPTESGRFSITVKAPKKLQAGTYRLSTWVRRTTRDGKQKLYPTFTLPRYVDLGRS